MKTKFNNTSKKQTEEWIWVKGFKGTDSNMRCKDMQYELNTQYDMPEDAKIVECMLGFHLCRDLGDVYHYYEIKNDHRFFEVTALVRKSDYDNYGGFTGGMWLFKSDKLVAKSIIFTRELTTDEILEPYEETREWSDQYKQLALSVGVAEAKYHMDADDLVSLGFSKPFALHVSKAGKYETAKAIGSQPGLSMDVKALLILG